MQVPIIKVHCPLSEDGWKLINKEDFVEGEHQEYSDEVKQEVEPVTKQKSAKKGG